VEPGLGHESLLGQAAGLPVPADNGAELDGQRMHGDPAGGKAVLDSGRDK
jgi:hypothetical protein